MKYNSNSAYVCHDLIPIATRGLYCLDDRSPTFSVSSHFFSFAQVRFFPSTVRLLGFLFFSSPAAFTPMLIELNHVTVVVWYVQSISTFSFSAVLWKGPALFLFTGLRLRLYWTTISSKHLLGLNNVCSYLTSVFVNFQNSQVSQPYNVYK